MNKVTLIKVSKWASEVKYMRPHSRDCNPGIMRFIRRQFWRSHRKDASRVIAEGLEGDNTLDLFDFWREDEALLRDIALINELEAELRAKCAILYSRQYDIMDQIYEVNRELERMHDDREELTQYRMSRGA